MKEEKIKGVLKNVLELSKLFPESITNYNNLIIKYWVMYDNVKNFDCVENATPCETITRALRKLVENGLIEIPGKVKKMKEKNREFFRTEFSNIANGF